MVKRKEDLQKIKKWVNKERCPLCDYILYEAAEGLICKTHNCPLHWKCNIGWVYFGHDSRRQRRLKHSMDFYADMNKSYYRPDLRNWLLFKSQIMERDDFKCRKCDKRTSETRIEVHHIMYRSEYPELAWDKENCITLCIECHEKIHSKDNRKFGQR